MREYEAVQDKYTRLYDEQKRRRDAEYRKIEESWREAWIRAGDFRLPEGVLN